LTLVALVMGGCGADDGGDKADAGSTQAKKPRRGYENSACISDARHLLLDAFNNITCAQALPVVDAYDQVLDDKCTLSQLKNGTCEVPDGGEAPYGSWKVKRGPGDDKAAWTKSSTPAQSFNAGATRRSGCEGEDADITDLDGATCEEAQHAYNTYQPLVLKCPSESGEVECDVPNWHVESFEPGRYMWASVGAGAYKEFIAEMTPLSPRFPR
jgi:hypothetical protein